MSADISGCHRFELLVGDRDHLSSFGFVATNEVVVIEFDAFLGAMIASASARPSLSTNFIAIGLGSTAVKRSTGMLTNPNVIVPGPDGPRGRPSGLLPASRYSSVSFFST